MTVPARIENLADELTRRHCAQTTAERTESEIRWLLDDLLESDFAHYAIRIIEEYKEKLPRKDAA